MPKEIYTAEEVAELLKIKKATVYQMVKDQKIRPFRIGRSFRFTQEEIDRFIDEQMQKEGNESR